ncbi:hypothetical protein B4U79_05357 [Dinothrombium tinctorium]|uniref:Uncharacterized protein n=1 Tax=Dinothrombium tinctorium TaxID=1965070 RepID=A0A3S3SKB2_9ACAR|nr:hypothetical protein B4U79_05357 [Dinothrombium tinctorium]
MHYTRVKTKYRKQYRELWQLRATFEAEEESNNTKNEVTTTSSKSDARLSKNDSGYKSIERKDYSIDYKSEAIFRQFTSTSLQKSPHQSIQEEQENEIQATYV